MQECDVQSGLFAALTRALESGALWESQSSVEISGKTEINSRFLHVHECCILTSWAEFSLTIVK